MQWRSIGTMTMLAPNPLPGAPRVELFLADKVADFAARDSARKCRLCGDRLKAIRVFVDSTTYKLIQTFECHCRERVWDDDDRRSKSRSKQT